MSVPVTAVDSAASATTPSTGARASRLMTRARWIEVARIVGVGLVVLLYRIGWIPLPVLLAGVAVGLYPLAKTALLDLVRERKIGTEVFVTVATVIAMIGREYAAGARAVGEGPCGRV